SRLPLTPRKESVRLACFRHAASVYPEPGSNSPSCDAKSLSLFSETPPLFPEAVSPKGIKCELPRLDHRSTRDACTHGGRVPTPLNVPYFSFWHVLLAEASFSSSSDPSKVRQAVLCSTLLLFRYWQQKSRPPLGRSGHIGNG